MKITKEQKQAVILSAMQSHDIGITEDNIKTIADLNDEKLNYWYKRMQLKHTNHMKKCGRIEYDFNKHLRMAEKINLSAEKKKNCKEWRKLHTLEGVQNEYSRKYGETKSLSRISKIIKEK